MYAKEINELYKTTVRALLVHTWHYALYLHTSMAIQAKIHPLHTNYLCKVCVYKIDEVERTRATNNQFEHHLSE